MRRFYLERIQDASGVSGLGKVAEGCQFDNGWCALVWIVSDKDADEVHGYYRTIKRIEEIHGHGGMTQVVWVDDESHNVVIKRDELSKRPDFVPCGHGSNLPDSCDCPPGCYCKNITCRPR